MRGTVSVDRRAKGCGSASKAGPRLVMLRYSKAVSKAARVVEIGVGRNPQTIFNSCFVSITCGRDGRGLALDADPHLFTANSLIQKIRPKGIPFESIKCHPALAGCAD